MSPTVEDELAEKESEIIRLRERLALLEAQADRTQSNDMGVAGRVAITRLRDTDFPELIAAVESIPGIFAEEGHLAAMSYCRTTIRSQIDSIILITPKTGDLVRTQHRIHMMLSEGQVELLFRADRIGVRVRTDLLEIVERYAFAPSIKAAFSHGQETPAGIMPTGFQGSRQS